MPFSLEGKTGQGKGETSTMTKRNCNRCFAVTKIDHKINFYYTDSGSG